MFPFILEDMSLVSQIYTMIQQFCPNRWIIVSPVESPACVEFKTYRFDRKRCRAALQALSLLIYLIWPVLDLIIFV